MKITAISDTHGHYPQLPGGDLLIIAGDLTASDRQAQYLGFRDWLRKQDYKKKIFICGNHDRCIEQGLFYFSSEWMGAEYLRNSGTEYEGLKIWGSPNSLYFDDVNQYCCAFMKTEEELAKIYAEIPDDIDILITHTPPYGILDQSIRGEHCGSKSLGRRIFDIKPKYHIFGHIHENGGEKINLNYENKFDCLHINCSYVNERYQPVNPAITITI